MFFAWFCNMAMHIGMSDLSVLRFAKKSWYAVASGTGMFLGHFLAWLAAAILYAFQMHQDPSNTSVLPGPLANNAAGLTGLICVIVAGWTTANPTIYRAGLAFQAIIPKSSRFRVTLITGAIATVAAMFPALAMKLLDFVALYGLILMPMGAVVFMDFWLIPKLGLRGSYAELSGRQLQLGRRGRLDRNLGRLPGHRLHRRQLDAVLRRPAGLVHRLRRVPRSEPRLPATGSPLTGTSTNPPWRRRGIGDLPCKRQPS